jgi:hypothetical protein
MQNADCGIERGRRQPSTALRAGRHKGRRHKGVKKSAEKRVMRVVKEFPQRTGE